MKIDLEDLGSKAKRASRGEWRMVGREHMNSVVSDGCDLEAANIISENVLEMDATYIVAAQPKVTRALVTRIRELEAVAECLISPRYHRELRGIVERGVMCEADSVGSRPTAGSAAAPCPFKLRGAHAFEACEDGALIIYATLPDEDGEPIRIEPHRVAAVLAACGDALARKSSTR